MQWNPITAAVVRAVTRFHAAVYQLTGGAGAIGRNTLVLTTKGRKTGQEISIPLYYVEDTGKLYIVGSFGGSDIAPGWYKNLSVNPEVKTRIGAETRSWRARTLSPDEKARVWPKLLAMYSSYADYEKRTTRVIPVVELSSA
jgi:deazaflavin-dependent oxidoreductase (nitroreductase family)